MKMRRWTTITGLLLLSLAAPAGAIPTLAIDADTLTPGIQSSAIVSVSDSFTVDIVISGVEASAPLNAFELDVLFDPGFIAAVSVIDGGFLLAPSIVVQQSVGVMSVEFAEVTLLPAGASGSGVLATLSFDATAEGTSALALANVILSAPFGVEIPVAGLSDASVQVGDRGVVIPEPTSALLFATGALAASTVTRRRRLRTCA